MGGISQIFSGRKIIEDPLPEVVHWGGKRRSYSTLLYPSPRKGVRDSTEKSNKSQKRKEKAFCSIENEKQKREKCPKKKRGRC